MEPRPHRWGVMNPLTGQAGVPVPHTTFDRGAATVRSDLIIRLSRPGIPTGSVTSEDARHLPMVEADGAILVDQSTDQSAEQSTALVPSKRGKQAERQRVTN